MGEEIWGAAPIRTAAQAVLRMAILLLAASIADAQATSTLPSAPTASNGATTSQGSTGGGFPVQVSTQSSLFNPYLGSVQAAPAVPRVISLTLDDALRMGIENNLGLVYARQTELGDQAQRLTAYGVILPNLDIQGSTAFHQYNLASSGFRADVIPQFAAALGGGTNLQGFKSVVKVDVTQGNFVLSQNLLNFSDFDLLKAVGHLLKSAIANSASSRGQVVQNVGVAYLRVIAAQSQIAFDQALLKTDEGVVYQSQQRHQAGITANLDELRSRVQYQTQQQALIGDVGALSKAKIALNRSIGLAPEQEIAVNDATPFADLEAMTPEDAERQALAARQDYQSSLEQLRAAEFERRAATRERYPTLVFNGTYGVTGVTGAIYHDTWTASGTLNIPVFREARFRADRDTAEFMLDNARAQVSNVRQQIAQQVRGSLIDLKSATATIAAAKSNAELGQVALQQSIERFQAGIDDNLPAIEAESTLAQAQVQFVNASFQYNQAKLNFARNLGIIDVAFHPEWQGGRPASLLHDKVTGH